MSRTMYIVIQWLFQTILMSSVFFTVIRLHQKQWENAIVCAALTVMLGAIVWICVKFYKLLGQDLFEG